MSTSCVEGEPVFCRVVLFPGLGVFSDLNELRDKNLPQLSVECVLKFEN